MRDIFAFLLSPLGLAASFLVFWMLLSLLWTPFPADAAARLIKSLLTLACVLPATASLPARTRAANLYALPLGVALTAVAALVFSAPGLPGAGATEAGENLSIGMEAALLLLWPALAATHLRGRSTLSAALVIVAVAAAASARDAGRPGRDRARWRRFRRRLARPAFRGPLARTTGRRQLPAGAARRRFCSM